jgi:predicted P-loop ATPase
VGQHPDAVTWATFPLFPINQEAKDAKGNYLCGCGKVECDRSGKHPSVRWGRIAKGEQIPTPEGYGTGIATGERSGIIVLDFDTMAALEAMEEAHELPATYMVKTPRGVHLYYRWPGFYFANTRGKLADKVDVRGDGGFVVAPGSLHKSGERYWATDPSEEFPVADAPQWLLDWERNRHARSTSGPGAGGGEPTDVATADGEEALEAFKAWLSAEPPCIEGEGGQDQLLKVALKGIRFYALPLEVVQGLLVSYNERCQPPWSDAELDHKLADARDGKWDRWPWNEYGTSKGLLTLVDDMVAAKATEREKAPEHVYTYDTIGTRRLPRMIPTKDGKGERDAGLTPTDFDALACLLNEDASFHRVFRYNEFDHRIYAVRPPMPLDAERGVPRFCGSDVSALRKWLATEKGVRPQDKSDVADVVELIAKGNRYHPIKDWLAGLPVPSTSHLDNLAETLFGDSRPEAQSFVRKQLIASVARVYEPGCKVDSVLTLVGEGGFKKTSTIKALYQVPGCNTFRSDLPDIRNMQAIGQALEGVWPVEMAELDVVKKADEDALKSFLTREDERYSPKYVAGEVVRPRQCIFWASTNDEEFLPRYDRAFRRRFWVVNVTRRIDLDRLAAIKDEVWSEALALYRAGGPELFWFEDERAMDGIKEEHVVADPWAETVEKAIKSIRPEAGKFERMVTATDIWRLLPGGADRMPSDPDFKRINKVCVAMGLERIRTKAARGFRLVYGQATKADGTTQVVQILSTLN